jgi:hypothetical protein
MSVENPLWGVPSIHGELLKLGFEVALSSVPKCMVKRRAPPSKRWRTFLRNHAPDIVAMDLFVVPTIGFDLLYGLTNPTAEWVARSNLAVTEEQSTLMVSSEKAIASEVHQMLLDSHPESAIQLIER